MDLARGEGAAGAARAGALRHPGHVFVRQQALLQRGEDRESDAQVGRGFEQAVLDVAVEHRVRGLMDEQGSAEVGEDRGGLAGLLRGVVRDAGIERLPAAHRVVQRPHGLLERGLGVLAVVVEDVDMVQAEPIQRLVQGVQQVLARAAVAVGAGPHEVPGLRRDHELVAVVAEVLLEDATQVGLRAARGRAVVVGQVEVGHAQIEGPSDDRAHGLGIAIVPEVLPEAQRDRGQAQAGSPYSPIGRRGVTVGGGDEGVGAHRHILRACALRRTTEMQVSPPAAGAP